MDGFLPTVEAQLKATQKTQIKSTVSTLRRSVEIKQALARLVTAYNGLSYG
jgi:hypothetical protein